MDILTVEEVAQRLRLNPFTIRRLLREGALRGSKVGKRQWRVQLRDLEAYLGQGSNGVAHHAQGRQPYPQDFTDIEAADLDAMLARVTPENRHELVDWGAPVGNEVW
ncbi:MAG: helix-turn-helix domain-containing protein [Chloroflexota bacterium]|nr:helix-turn-helix domain-containing protein [Chloroflexota bacterium]MDQ5866793.1 helix-turn-helix domain-containing protein [Chloroflexota bacterium]